MESMQWPKALATSLTSPKQSTKSKRDLKLQFETILDHDSKVQEKRFSLSVSSSPKTSKQLVSWSLHMIQNRQRDNPPKPLPALPTSFQTHLTTIPSLNEVTPIIHQNERTPRTITMDHPTMNENIIGWFLILLAGETPTPSQPAF